MLGRLCSKQIATRRQQWGQRVRELLRRLPDQAQVRLGQASGADSLRPSAAVGRGTLHPLVHALTARQSSPPLLPLALRLQQVQGGGRLHLPATTAKPARRPQQQPALLMRSQVASLLGGQTLGRQDPTACPVPALCTSRRRGASRQEGSLLGGQAQGSQGRHACPASALCTGRGQA